ncbi:hypothetical protein B4N89_27540 [Embleya scabrispora]|uniref:HTH luxR-type domain-containing protein n=1 Tax=Embleya scabrispora TaxID=159449 RepID=A0A1T3P5E3_9ACTN|nr:helix-turn-helix transcriptional regulator [Embleya scabrispora]OPC84181.1 hypothetical protein B4N89_27540 [Embleya scabrispora]
MAIETATTHARIRDALLDGADLHHLNVTVREVDVLAAMVDLALNGGNETREGRLHGRAVEVLAGLGRGLSNADIGREMGLNEGTVRKYASELFKTLGACNRGQAVVLGLASGDLDLAELAEAIARDNLAAEHSRGASLRASAA